MTTLSLTAVPDLVSSPPWGTLPMTEKVQLAPTSWIAVWGLFLTAIIAGFSGVYVVVGVATTNSERMVRLETAVVMLNTTVSEMSQNNKMLSLHAEQISELQKYRERTERRANMLQQQANPVKKD